jgi:hypothetical protein
MTMMRCPRQGQNRLIVDQPRDIALAIRVKFASTEAALGEARRTEQSWEDVEEAFDELGMEVVDELASPEEDDERREPLFTLPKSSASANFR